MCSAFRHLHFEANPPVTGRFGALKILLAEEDRVAVAVLDGVWNEMPGISDAGSCGILKRTFFAWNGRSDVFSAQWEPEGLALIGNAPLDAEQLRFADKYQAHAIGCSYAYLHSAFWSVEAQWRWDNDRDALIAEEDERERREEEKRRLAEERYQKRLKGLTWATLESEKPYKGWTSYPPKAFTEKLTIWTYDLYKQLQALGPKPKKAQVRKVMKDYVVGVNILDEEMDHPIETEERERLCEVIEEALHVARHRSLMDEVDEWRDW